MLPQGLPTDQGISTPVVTPDGSRLFVSVENTLFAVHLPDGQIVQSATLNFKPSSLAVNQDRNELYVGTYGSGGVIVLAADSLTVQRNFGGFASIYTIALRPVDGALLVSSDEDGYRTQRLDAVDVVTGERLATSTGTGYYVVVSVDGTRIYRLRVGDYTDGPYADTSESLVVLDALSLNTIGVVPLDTRPQDDPTRQYSAIRTTFNNTPAAAVPKVSVAVEYLNAALGHYFVTSMPAEINALDTGVFIGWTRTGETLPLYAQRDDGPDAIVPVCRFYGRPEKGLDSHFYSASAAECAAVQQNWADRWLLESSDVFDVYPADVATGLVRSRRRPSTASTTIARTPIIATRPRSPYATRWCRKGGSPRDTDRTRLRSACRGKWCFKT